MSAGSHRVRRRLGAVGINRSALLRRLPRLGHPRLRELRARALQEHDPTSRALRLGVDWLERGVLRIPQGHAGGIVIDMRYLPISHAHFGSIAFGNLEAAVQEAMVRHLGPGGVFYDIGANLGFFSLLGAHLVGPEGRVYAFEPAPDNASAIRANAELNGLSQIEVIEVAAASESGRGRLQVVDDQSWSKLVETGEHPFTEKVLEVELASVDDLLEDGRVRPPTVIKIDVEGAELSVLEGTRKTIERHQPAIICELHDTHADFVKFAEAIGYRVINLEGTVPMQHAGASAHALALPSQHPGD